MYTPMLTPIIPFKGSKLPHMTEQHVKECGESKDVNKTIFTLGREYNLPLAPLIPNRFEQSLGLMQNCATQWLSLKSGLLKLIPIPSRITKLAFVANTSSP